MSLSILLVDAEPSLGPAVRDALQAAGHRVAVTADPTDARRRVCEHAYDVVLCDVTPSDADGVSVFDTLRREAPDTDVIVIASDGSVPAAVAALKRGATDYLTKPVSVARLVHDMGRIAARRQLQRELQRARRVLGTPSEPPITGDSAAVRRLLARVDTMAGSDAPVLIVGETGTGKELVARALHTKSPRRDKPLITINCAAFPETLIEAELFGHERGAFTGAVKRRAGRFTAADGGTLFLDEVAELPPQAQAKLLRVLQEGTFEPLGSNTTIRVNVRLISATHQPLKELVAARRFREDLFYRLKVLDLRLPPLRERRNDIPALVDRFIARYATRGAISGLSPGAWAALAEHPWPGNVRELEHAIHHAVVLAGHGEIDRAHLPDELANAAADHHGVAPEVGVLQPLRQAMKDFERGYLERALAASGGNRTQTAAALGISRKNLWEKLKAHRISWAPDALVTKR